MPNRIVREGLLRSGAWNSCGDAEAQLLFVRLLLVADDWGTFDGRLEVIASACFPAAPAPDLMKLLDQLHRAGLIIRYANAGKAFIAIPQWGGDYRGKRRYPAPPINVDQVSYDDEGKPRRLRGVYGKPIQWRNPPGSDDISILLDTHGKPTVPQPAEWRNVSSDWSPMTGTSSDSPAVTTAQSLPSGTTGKDVDVDVDVEPIPSPKPEAQAKAVVTTPQSLDAEEMVDFNGHDFVGLTEAKRLHWQDMFHQLAIPDEVARAAAWLEQHADEREAIRKSGTGFGPFLIRWLLRSARPAHAPYAGKH